MLWVRQPRGTDRPANPEFRRVRQPRGTDRPADPEFRRVREPRAPRRPRRPRTAPGPGCHADPQLRGPGAQRAARGPAARAAPAPRAAGSRNPHGPRVAGCLKGHPWQVTGQAPRISTTRWIRHPCRGHPHPVDHPQNPQNPRQGHPWPVAPVEYSPPLMSHAGRWPRCPQYRSPQRPRRRQQE